MWFLVLSQSWSSVFWRFIHSMLIIKTLSFRLRHTCSHPKLGCSQVTASPCEPVSRKNAEEITRLEPCMQPATFRAESNFCFMPIRQRWPHKTIIGRRRTLCARSSKTFNSLVEVKESPYLLCWSQQNHSKWEEPEGTESSLLNVPSQANLIQM